MRRVNVSSLFALAVVLFAALAARGAQAQVAEASANAPPGSTLSVSLLTFGPGEEVWERFGHNAIEIHDDATGETLWYNYGIFDFAQENFFLNFARGLMLYRVAADEPADELPTYLAEGRWIVRQRLHLTPAQREQLDTFLRWNVQPDNAQYRYDYFRDNCATRVRDALDRALGGAIKAQTISPSRGYTYRMEADRLMRPDLAIMLAVDAGLGPFADQRLSYWNESFIPMELMRYLRDIRVRDDSGASVPLVESETQLAAARIPDPREFPPNWTWTGLASGFGAAIVLLVLSRMRAYLGARIAFGSLAAVTALTFGIAGLVLLGLWTLTDHVSAWRNENCLLFNPLCLLLIPTWLRSMTARWQPSRFAQRLGVAIALFAVVAWIVKILPGFTQDNFLWISLIAPWHIALALILRLRAPRAA